MYPVELVKLQIDFAKKAQEIEKIEFSLALLKFSPIARFLGIKYSEMSVENPIWLELIYRISKCRTSLEQAEMIISYKRSLPSSKEHSFDINGNPKAEFGCFNFDYNPEKKQIQIHFSNNYKGDPGPLSKEQMPMRMKELKDMFTFIKQNHPDAQTVRGHSWLYSIVAYKRLFPPEYLASGQIKQTFLNTSMWGQFIDSSEKLKLDLAEKFEECINTKVSIEGLATCFPFQQPKVSANIQVFYDFYNIT
jgi:hypothetical protein